MCGSSTRSAGLLRRTAGMRLWGRVASISSLYGPRVSDTACICASLTLPLFVSTAVQSDLGSCTGFLPVPVGNPDIVRPSPWSHPVVWRCPAATSVCRRDCSALVVEITSGRLKRIRTGFLAGGGVDPPAVPLAADSVPCRGLPPGTHAVMTVARRRLLEVFLMLVVG